MKGLLRELGPLRMLLAVLFLASAMVMMGAGWWTIINGLAAWSDRADVANSTEILALVEATGDREVTRRHVRRMEKFADVAWRDARDSVRRARIGVQPDALIKQGQTWFVRLRYFEHDASRLPLTQDGQSILSRADESEARAISGLIVVFLTIASMLGLFIAMRKSKRIDSI